MNKSRYLLFFFLKFFWCLNLHAQTIQLENIDSELAKISDDIIKLDSLKSWSVYSESLSISDALVICKKGKTLATHIKSAKWKAAFDFLLGANYVDLGNADSAQFHFQLATDYYISENNQKKVAAIEMKKARLYINQGIFDKAYEAANNALEIFEKLDDQPNTADALIYISDALYYQERYEEGVDFSLRALQYYQSFNDSSGIVQGLQYVSGNYHGLGDKENAFKYADQAVKLQRTLDDDLLALGSVVNARGDVLKDMSRYEEALIDFKESNAIAKKFNHAGGISATNANIANVYVRMGEFKKALPLKLEAVAMQESSGFNTNLMVNYQDVAHIYEELENPVKALLFYKKYAVTRDSFLSLEKDKATSELLTQYETEKKEEQIVLQKSQINQQQKVQNLSFGLFGLLGVLILGLIYGFQKNKTVNQKLASLNDSLSVKNKENEVLLKEIHHRVKNNLQTISSLLNLQSNSISDPTALDAVQESRNRVASMALIHQKLYQGENLAAIEMRDYFETIGNAILDSFGEKANQVELDIDMPEIELDVDTAIPIGLITNELITNSLKYAFLKKESGKISIAMKRAENHMIQLKIADNGTHNELAGESQNGTGFGTMLVQLLTTQLGGEIKKSTEGGTSTVIQFALKKELAA